MADGPTFSEAFRTELHDLLVWRRDVRRFRRDPLPAGLMERLVAVASLAPSVGLSEPWRFVVVESQARRASVRASFERCNEEALAGMRGERAALYARLKLAGLDEAPGQFALFADRAAAQGGGLGRATMPATSEYSAVMAAHTLWLVARAEGLGLGWVSILEPAVVTIALDVPPDWTFVGYFCLGYPQAQDDTPALQRAGWESRAEPHSVLIQR